jgi:arylsulfatase A
MTPQPGHASIHGMRFRCLLALLFLILPHLGHTTERPNIIYILADDLGYGDLSCYGQEHFETPHLDSLAQDGMRFTRHYSGSTVCAPSRCSLMTGLHTGHAYIRGNLAVHPEGQQPMPADTVTIAHILKAAGYATGVFGKWGLGAPGSVSEPLQMGFDRFYGYNCQRLAHHYYPYFLWNDQQREILWENVGLERGEYAPDLIQDQLLDWIEDNRDQPFFCYYALIQPHAEMFAPEEYMQQFRGRFLPETAYDGTDSGPDFRKGRYGSQPEGHAAFAAMVTHMDEDIGEIVAKLEALGIAQNTLIIFSSDNGPHAEAGHNPDYFDSNGALRGIKRDLYEGGIRVPMIAHWPGRIAPGSVSSHLSAFWDIMPTLADVAGQPEPEHTDGISFLPTLLNDREQAQHAFLYWEFPERGGRIAIRMNQWKGIRYHVATAPQAPLELYNLLHDPSETINVSADHPEIVEQLEALLKEARNPSPVAKFNFPERFYDW